MVPTTRSAKKSMQTRGRGGEDKIWKMEEVTNIGGVLRRKIEGLNN